MLFLLLSYLLNFGGPNTYQQGQNVQYRPDCVPWVCMVFNSIVCIEPRYVFLLRLEGSMGSEFCCEHTVSLCSFFFLPLCLAASYGCCSWCDPKYHHGYVCMWCLVSKSLTQQRVRCVRDL